MPVRNQDPEAIITLSCPACNFALNMRRKHIGLEGKCISCSEPIQAIEEQPGKVVVVSKKAPPAPKPETKAVHKIPAKIPAPAPAPAAPLPSIQETANDTPDDSKWADSKWGFPTPGENSEPPVAVTPAPEPTSTPEPDPAPESTPAPQPESTAPANGFFDELPTEVSNPSGKNTAGDNPEPPAPAPEKQSPPPAFSGEDRLDATVALFASDQDDTSTVNTGWGTKVPSETHASISPFATGSAEPETGFAETLFREGVENKAPAEPAAKSSLFSNDDSGNFGTNALFSSGPASSSPAPSQPKPATGPEIGENGDPVLPPMTEEEEEQFAKDMMSFQASRDAKSSPKWVKKLTRLLVTMGILFGVGYAVYVFVPDEKLGGLKEKAKNWLEPGLVIFDYLPVGPGAKDGDKPKGFQQLDQLKQDMGKYQDRSQDLLNDTYKDGESGLDFEEGRGGSGNDENATGLEQLGKLKDDIGQYRERSKDQLNDTYDGKSELDFDEGRIEINGDRAEN